MMRAWGVAVVLAACSKEHHGGRAAYDWARAAATVPTVAVPTVLANDTTTSPLLLIVDKAGEIRIGAAKSWTDLDTHKVHVATRVLGAHNPDAFPTAGYEINEGPPPTILPFNLVTSWDTFGGGSLHDVVRAIRDNEEPPPEEEDDVEEPLDPLKARQREVERARSQNAVRRFNPREEIRTVDGRPRLNTDGTPGRLAEAEGVVADGGTLERTRAMIVMTATAKATALIELVRDTDAAIAVSYQGTLRPLHIEFGWVTGFGWRFEADDWIEARVSANGIVIEAVPDVPIENVELTQIGAAVERARTLRGTSTDAPVDVLVDADVDVQRLIDVVVALDTAGVRVIGMGSTPPPEELARRGHRTPTLALGQPVVSSIGPFDKRQIRQVMKRNKPLLRACFDRAIATNPEPYGTVSTQFLVKPDGRVGVAEATGVDPAISGCVLDVVKTLTFPQPKGGVEMQVSYPISFRP